MSSSTTREQIAGWLRDAARNGARWVLIAHDDFDGDDYPVAVAPDADPWVRHDQLVSGGDHVHEVYDLDGDLVAQLDAARTWALPGRGA